MYMCKKKKIIIYLKCSHEHASLVGGRNDKLKSNIKSMHTVKKAKMQKFTLQS